MMTKEEIQEIINQWLKEWCVPVPEEKLRQEENQLQEDNSYEENEEEDSLEDFDSAESQTPSIPIDPKSENEVGEP